MLITDIIDFKKKLEDKDIEQIFRTLQDLLALNHWSLDKPITEHQKEARGRRIRFKNSHFICCYIEVSFLDTQNRTIMNLCQDIYEDAKTGTESALRHLIEGLSALLCKEFDAEAIRGS